MKNGNNVLVLPKLKTLEEQTLQIKMKNVRRKNPRSLQEVKERKIKEMRKWRKTLMKKKNGCMMNG